MINRQNLDETDDNRSTFIQRLMEAGWTETEAIDEWESIQEDEESGT